MGRPEPVPLAAVPSDPLSPLREKDRRKMKVSRLGWKVEEVEDVSIDERSVDFDESRWKMIRKSGANQLRRLD
jgi:hypothetical protein